MRISVIYNLYHVLCDFFLICNMVLDLLTIGLLLTQGNAACHQNTKCENSCQKQNLDPCNGWSKSMLCNLHNRLNQNTKRRYATRHTDVKCIHINDTHTHRDKDWQRIHHRTGNKA